MSGKGLNVIDDCAGKWVYLCSQEAEWSSSSWGHSKIYSPGTIGNLKTGRASTKINKNGAVVKVRILVEVGMYMDLAAILRTMLIYWT